MAEFYSQLPAYIKDVSLRSHVAKLGAVLTGTLAGTLIHAFCFVPIAYAQSGRLLSQAQPIVQTPQPAIALGVVRSPDNADQWQGIVARLKEAGISYQVIEWQQVQQTADLGNVTVLFLPDIETISAEQLLALQGWINGGGRVIVSGPIGDSSSAGVRRALRSLLGAYWATSLTQPAMLQPLYNPSQSWLQAGSTSSRVSGGVVVPIGLSSAPVAVWGNPPSMTSPTTNSPIAADLAAKIGTAAVVINNQSTFLGWRWGGTNSGSEFDESWLKAAIARFQANPTGDRVLPSGATLATPSSTGVSATRLSFSAPPISSPSPTVSGSTQTSSAQTTPSPSQDPAEQTAPPGLEVQRSTLPISVVEAIAMRQELQSLMGRFESALLSANSVTANPDLRSVVPASRETETKESRSTEPTLTASTDNMLPVSVAASAEATPAEKALLQAQQNMQTFSQLVSRRDYEGAREQWLATRQLLWDNFPTDRPLAQPEIRAVWLDRGTIVQAGSRQGLVRIFDQFAAAGINTVFFETVNAGYPIYPSRVAPQQNPLTQGWDPLKAAVELAHERGMELHAWVWTFAVGNRAHNHILDLPSDYLGPVITAHPDWANSDKRGNPIPLGQAKPFLDPANPAVRQYLLSLFEEIVTQYPVDGLQLDYIRYPFQDPGAGRTYGYGLSARQQFQKLTGVDPIALSPQSNPQLWQRWTDFRIEQINSFVAATSALVHRLRPHLILSTAVFAQPEHQRIQEIQQDWEVWARRGDVDLIVLMSYAMDTNRLQQLTHSWLTNQANLGSTLVLPGIRLLHLPNSAIVDQMQALRDSPAGGYALFAADNLNPDLQTILDQTQGAKQPHQATLIPYRQPFATAASRYTALQREWSFLLSHKQLWIREQQQETWQTQAEGLGQALKQLASHPSPQHLQQAKTLLKDFRSQFDDWMYLQSLSDSYRVHTWENHLATLDDLLNYGERVVLGRQDINQADSSNP